MFKQALAFYNEGIVNNPTEGSLFSNRGNVYTQLWGSMKRPLMISNHPSFYLSLGVKYFRLGDYVQALENYNHAIELNPEYGAAYQGRAATHYALGNMSQANADRQRAVELGYGQ